MAISLAYRDCGGACTRPARTKRRPGQSTWAYECRPTATKLITYRLISIVPQAATTNHVAVVRFTLGVARACRYAAYATQEMNDQVSFGSQPQYRPHAASAQIAPQITARVQIG